MTEEPKIVEKKCRAKNLYPGTYYYCRCGRSKDGIFCDESHVGTDFQPKRFKVSEPTTVSICMCRHSKNMPYCDGAHKTL